MGAVKHTRADDERLLQMMHLHDVEGLSYGQIAERFVLSRSSVAGYIRRVKSEADLVTSECVAPENMDGGMGVRWWAK